MNGSKALNSKLNHLMEETELTVAKLQTLLMQAAYGCALLAANSLESKLATLLMCHAIENDYPIPQSIKKMTFGALVNEFVAKYHPSEEIEEELDNLVFFRNDLVHRICETIVHATIDVNWKDKIIEELTAVENFFRDTDHLLHPYTKNVSKVLKLSEADLLCIAKKMYPGISESSADVHRGLRFDVTAKRSH